MLRMAQEHNRKERQALEAQHRGTLRTHLQGQRSLKQHHAASVKLLQQHAGHGLDASKAIQNFKLMGRWKQFSAGERREMKAASGFGATGKDLHDALTSFHKKGEATARKNYDVLKESLLVSRQSMQAQHKQSERLIADQVKQAKTGTQIVGELKKQPQVWNRMGREDRDMIEKMAAKGATGENIQAALERVHKRREQRQAKKHKGVEEKSQRQVRHERTASQIARRQEREAQAEGHAQDRHAMRQREKAVSHRRRHLGRAGMLALSGNVGGALGSAAAGLGGSSAIAAVPAAIYQGIVKTAQTATWANNISQNQSLTQGQKSASFFKPLFNWAMEPELSFKGATEQIRQTHLETQVSIQKSKQAGRLTSIEQQTEASQRLPAYRGKE